MEPEQRTLDDGNVVISLEGDADLAAVPAFRAAVQGAMERSVPGLILDFARATFVNTPVWAVVVEYYQHVSKSGGNFALAGLSGRVEASFDIIRLGEFIRHFPTVDDALDSFGG